MERIISTKRPVSIEQALGETGLTVVEYGTPDASSLPAYDIFARRRYARAVELALRAFEPRLRDPVVRVELRADGPAKLEIVIAGAIVLGDHAEDVSFPIHVVSEAFGRAA